MWSLLTRCMHANLQRVAVAIAVSVRAWGPVTFSEWKQAHECGEAAHMPYSYTLTYTHTGAKADARGVWQLPDLDFVEVEEMPAHCAQEEHVRDRPSNDSDVADEGRPLELLRRSRSKRENILG